MLDKVLGIFSESIQLILAEMDLMFRLLALMLPLLLMEVVLLFGLLLITCTLLRLVSDVQLL